MSRACVNSPSSQHNGLICMNHVFSSPTNKEVGAIKTGEDGGGHHTAGDFSHPFF